MNPDFKRFFIKASILLLIMLAAGFVAFNWIVPEYFNMVFIIAALFFYSFTLIVHAWQLKTAKKSLSEFARSNMIAMFVKLIVYLSFTIAVYALDRENAVAFTIVILILYFSFTIIEVTSLSKFSRSQDKKTNK
jgi:hypothetical protein